MGLRWRQCSDAWRRGEFLCVSVCGAEVYGEAEVCLGVCSCVPAVSMCVF